MRNENEFSNLFGTSELKGKSLYGLIMIITTIIILTIIAFAFIAIEFFEGAMFAFTGSFLVSVLLWVFLSAKQVEKFLRHYDPNISLKDKLLLLAVGGIIFIFITAIFITGDSIAWWRVRVNQQSYELSGLIIPKAFTTVASTFFSSIILLTWITLKRVSNQAEELNIAELNNENPLTIIERRERYISKTVNSVGKKGLIFVAVIGITIVFASDLSVYATQGILIIIPFVIAAFLTLVLVSFYQKRKKSPVQIVLDNLIVCSNCGKKTPLGGSFCEKCGERIVLGNRFNDAKPCDNCGEINSKDSKYCRYCSTELKKLKQIQKN